MPVPNDEIATDELGPAQPMFARYDSQGNLIHQFNAPLGAQFPKAPAAPKKSPFVKDAATVMDSMAATFRERQKSYGSNYRMVAPIVATLFPMGVPQHLVTSDKWHLFELMIVKLSRFAISNLSHTDSIHDLGVYAAMVEACVLEENAK